MENGTAESEAAARAGAPGPGQPHHYYVYELTWRTTLPQVLAVSAKNLLLLTYGMTLGFPTILIPAVTSHHKVAPGETLKLTSDEESWLGSLNLMSVPLGCVASGALSGALGRRRAMQLLNAPFLAAWLLLHYATTRDQLYAALCITGLTGGLLEAPVLTYVAEVTEPRLRGVLAATSSLSIIVGVCSQYLLGALRPWRTVALINTGFTVVSVLALCFIPESPHWLVSRGRLGDATKSLQWLRGWTTAERVQSELDDIRQLYGNTATSAAASASSDSGRESWRARFALAASHYCRRTFVLPYLLITYSFFVGHFCGMTSLQTYVAKILEVLHNPLEREYATPLLGGMQVAGTCACVLLVRRLGKRPLAGVSLVGTGLCCLAVAAYDILLHAAFQEGSGVARNLTATHSGPTAAAPNAHILLPESAEHAWVPVAALLLLAALSHVGIRLLPWILIGEVFSARTRCGAAGLSSATGYVLGFLANKFFSAMLDTLAVRGTYAFYAFVSLSGAAVLYRVLPETEGKTLGEIQDHFAGLARLDNRVRSTKERAAADHIAVETQVSKL